MIASTVFQADGWMELAGYIPTRPTLSDPRDAAPKPVLREREESECAQNSTLAPPVALLILCFGSPLKDAGSSHVLSGRLRSSSSSSFFFGSRSENGRQNGLVAISSTSTHAPRAPSRPVASPPQQNPPPPERQQRRDEMRSTARKHDWRDRLPGAFSSLEIFIVVSTGLG